jgi:hypothetical protein
MSFLAGRNLSAPSLPWGSVSPGEVLSPTYLGVAGSNPAVPTSWQGPLIGALRPGQRAFCRGGVRTHGSLDDPQPGTTWGPADAEMRRQGDMGMQALSSWGPLGDHTSCIWPDNQHVGTPTTPH